MADEIENIDSADSNTSVDSEVVADESVVTSSDTSEAVSELDSAVSEGDDAFAKNSVSDQEIHSEEEAEEFDDEYFDISAIESELQVLVPNLTEISATLVEAVELSTENALKLNQQENSLIGAFKSLADFKKDQIKFATIMLVTTGGIIAVGLGLFLVTIFSFSNKSQELSALNLALGKRVVEMNAGLTSFEQAKAEVATLRGLIEELAVGVEQTRASYSDSEQEIQGQISSYSESLTGELTAQTSALGDSFEGLGQKVSAFETKLNGFDTRLRQTDAVLTDIQSNAQSMLEVKSVVEALLVLERERYIEALEMKAAAPSATTESVAREGEIYFGN